MTRGGLRERKREQTRQLIADTAARLFADRGYEHVTVRNVAQAADVSEQTVYNYFPSKEHLVIDRDEFIRGRLSELIRSRPESTSPVAAIREFVLGMVVDIPQIPEDQWRGELGYLSAISPAVHRLVLEMSDRRGCSIAADISATTSTEPEIARLQGMALANVLQIILSETGQRTQKGQPQTKIAAELIPVVERLFEELEWWFSDAPRAARPESATTAVEAARPR